jgi:hypothetical protein
MGYLRRWRCRRVNISARPHRFRCGHESTAHSRPISQWAYVNRLSMMRLNHHLASISLAGFVLASGPVSSNAASEDDIGNPIIEAEFMDCMVSFNYNCQP